MSDNFNDLLDIWVTKYTDFQRTRPLELPLEKGREVSNELNFLNQIAYLLMVSKGNVTAVAVTGDTLVWTRNRKEKEGLDEQFGLDFLVKTRNLISKKQNSQEEKYTRDEFDLWLYTHARNRIYDQHMARHKHIKNLLARSRQWTCATSDDAQNLMLRMYALFENYLEHLSLWQKARALTHAAKKKNRQRAIVDEWKASCLCVFVADSMFKLSKLPLFHFLITQEYENLTNTKNRKLSQRDIELQRLYVCGYKGFKKLVMHFRTRQSFFKCCSHPDYETRLLQVKHILFVPQVDAGPTSATIASCIHAEIAIFSYLNSKKLSKITIGVSKATCACCNRLLTLLGDILDVNIIIRPTRDRPYATWAFPTWFPQDCEKRMIYFVKDQILAIDETLDLSDDSDPHSTEMSEITQQDYPDLDTDFLL